MVNVLPNVNGDIETNNVNINAINYPTDSWLINQDTKLTTFSTNYLQLIHQTVDAILSVNRYSYEIYEENDVGWLFSDLPGLDLELVIALSQDRIKSALSIDERILSVENFTFEKISKNTLLIKFDVITIFGDYREEVKVAI